MNSLKNFEEILNKCSRCGLCQAVCPIYKLTKNDCTSPKGKCILIGNLIKSGNSPSKEIVKYFKTCSNCGKCIDFCPGKIDIVKINKAFLEKYNKTSLFEKLFKNMFLIFLRIKAEMFKNNRKIQGRVAYIKPYSQKYIPDEIKKYNPDIIESFGCDLDFIINNPELFEKLAEETSSAIHNIGYDSLITNNLLCQFELEKGFKKMKIPEKIIYLP